MKSRKRSGVLLYSGHLNNRALAAMMQSILLLHDKFLPLLRLMKELEAWREKAYSIRDWRQGCSALDSEHGQVIKFKLEY